MPLPLSNNASATIQDFVYRYHYDFVSFKLQSALPSPHSLSALQVWQTARHCCAHRQHKRQLRCHQMLAPPLVPPRGHGCFPRVPMHLRVFYDGPLQPRRHHLRESHKDSFCPGLGYVMLSRVVSRAQLYLLQKTTPEDYTPVYLPAVCVMEEAQMWLERRPLDGRQMCSLLGWSFEGGTALRG